MKNTALLTLSLALAATAAGAATYTRYVDPTVGTGGHGHVFLGANVPFGMAAPGPNQYEEGWDWCSGYHRSGQRIIGFTQTHLSGTGCGDLLDIGLMPAYGAPALSREGLASTYSHDSEQARPGYYRVTLDRGHITAEMTATRRCALYRFTYPTAADNARLVIDLENSCGGNRAATVHEARLTPIDSSTLVGHRKVSAWAGGRTLYFAVRCSKSISRWTPQRADTKYGQAVFSVKAGERITVSVGLSPTSEANALLNLNAELGPTPDFDTTAAAADELWDRQLGRIQAGFRTDRERRVFYTAMFHFMVAPQTWCDLTGDYHGADGRTHRSAPYETLATWSLWDTYRAAHPLATLIMPDRMADYARTIMAIWRESGELPVWHLAGHETYCMVGEPAVPVLADLIIKGLDGGTDPEEAMQAVKESLLPTLYPTSRNRRLPLRGKDRLASLGYLPYDGTEEKTVSKSLEYFLACGAAARLAGHLGHTDDSLLFDRYAQGFRLLYDPQTHMMRAKDSLGHFRPLTPEYNPCHQTRDYTEGTPWQYRFLVPHDVGGMIALMGGQKAFAAALDSLFAASSDAGEHANADVTGLIGQYAHGNEPDHHVAYLYNYAGQPAKTQRAVRRIMAEMYSDTPDGLCGNEDVGQMSAWYILSALGLYQVEPCGGVYQLGAPIVTEAKLPMPQGKTFIIRTHGLTDTKTTVRRRTLNGHPLRGNSLTHGQITQGGVLDVYY